MNQRTFRMRRRVGAALLAGVTALGVATLAGEGVANAAAPTVSASSATATTSLGTATTAGSAITITITGSSSNPINSSDTINLVVACPSSGTVSFSSATATSSQLTTTAGTPTSNNACGSNIKNVLPITWTGSSTSTATITVTPTYSLSNVPSGSLSLSGTYIQTGGSVNFAVPSDLTVANVSVTPATPLSIIPPGSGNAAIGNLTVTLPANNTVAAGDWLCVELTPTTAGNVVFSNISGNPTVTQINGASNATVTTNSSTTTATLASIGTTNNTVAFQQLTQSQQNPPVFQLSNLHVNVLSGATTGTKTATVWYSTSSSCSSPTSLITAQTVMAVGSAAGAAIYGQTPAATTAAEFEKQFVTTSGNTATCSNNGNIVLATSADPYDALSAAYLEAQLSTGVVITSPTSVDANALAAMKYAGVQRVYVVGGPDAVSQSVISALQSTPAYNCGGLSTTGSNLIVEPSIYGQTAADTAVAIDNYITGNGEGGTGTYALPSLAGAFGSESTYNQTVGNETTTAPTGTQTTAIVVAETDWEDATTAAGIAYAYHLPIILTPQGSLGTQASGELSKLGITQVIALGGQLALSNNVVTAIQAMSVNGTPVAVLRIAGADKTQTAADLALFEGSVLGWKNSTVYAAQGSYWSDALGAAPLSGVNKSAVLLTEGPTQTAGTYTDGVLKTAGTPPNGLGSGLTTSIQVLGGPLAVPQSQINEMNAALAAG